MLLNAYNARTAYRFGPKQQRRMAAFDELRAKYMSNLIVWSDFGAEPRQIGYPIRYPTAELPLPRRNQMQNTTVSQQPLLAVVDGIKCGQFDGVNDVIFGISGGVPQITTKATVITLRKMTSATTGSVVERPGNYTTVTTGWRIYGNKNLGGASYKGDVGYVTREWVTDQNKWNTNVIVMDKTVNSANKMLVYENGVQVTSFSTSTDTNNTNDFGTQVNYYGGLNGSFFMTGSIAQVLTLDVALTPAEVARVTQLVRWRAGFAV